ncbi:MAG: sulfatase-like hydrolase/transferase [bacterium]|nr:sulfatase-like hydrolase/transferase [bacterium]
MIPSDEHRKAAVPATLWAGLVAGFLVLPPGSGTAATAAPAAAEVPTPKAIVLVTVDTLRADCVSFNGYPHKTTPYLDGLARDGIVMSRAYSSSSWTSPAMASLFTGLYPTSHGITSGVWKKDRVMEQPVLSGSLVTLAEKFKEAGYLTVGVPSNRHLSEGLGFAQGFDSYFDRADFLLAPAVNSRVRDQLRELLGPEWPTVWKTRKVFLWIHYFDPHVPLLARKPWINHYAPDFEESSAAYPSGMGQPALNRRYPHPGSEAAARIRPLYDSEISFWDDRLRMLGGELGLDDPDVLLLVTSDHGEEIADHGRLGHRHTLYEELVRVPMLVRWPRGLPGGRTINKLVSLVDVYPTLLELGGVEVPAGLQGESLAELLRGNKTTAASRLYFELHPPNPPLVGITDGRWKLIRTREARSPAELYDLVNDQAEQTNVAGTHQEVARGLTRALRDWMESLPKAKDLKMLPLEDEELKKQLEALGYIDDEEGEPK